jgi:hypothetical protein
MSDTAQPSGAAESEVVSAKDALASAAEAFKLSLGQAPARELPPRGEGGRFVAAEAADDETDLDPGLRRDDEDQFDAQEEADPASSSDANDEEADTGEAGEEPQPEPRAMPSSWAREDEMLWSSLPPEAQAKIAAREGQRDRAVNLKFQEAANVLKANEGLLAEAQGSRQRYADAIEQVLSLVVPQPPPRTMLDPNSDDYDPDAWHYRKAVHEDTIAFLDQHKGQLGQIRAQDQLQSFQAINGATRDAFIASVPDIADQAKAPAIFQDLIDYAISLGSPADIFQAPTTALEWHVLWKAREYDRLQQARARVKETPRPEPRKPQPAVRPGVTTPRAAIEQHKRGAALDRLRKEGSVDAGAAAIKHLMKGTLS